jgi:hypothetical protein
MATVSSIEQATARSTFIAAPSARIRMLKGPTTQWDRLVHKSHSGELPHLAAKSVGPGIA